MKINKISLQNLSQNELQRKQVNTLMGGKVCECTVECSVLCTCTYTQTLQNRQASILVHPVTQNTSDNANTTDVAYKNLGKVKDTVFNR